MVCDTAVGGLPHASVAVHVLVSDCWQPLPVCELVTTTVGVLQLSAKVGAVKAALIAVAVGLHPMLASAPSAVATVGDCVSTV